MTNWNEPITRKELAAICEGLFDVKSFKESYNYIREHRDGVKLFDVYVTIGSGKVFAEENDGVIGYRNCIFLFTTNGNITLKKFAYRAEIECRGRLKNVDATEDDFHQ